MRFSKKMELDKIKDNLKENPQKGKFDVIVKRYITNEEDPVVRAHAVDALLCVPHEGVAAKVIEIIGGETDAEALDLMCKALITSPGKYNKEIQDGLLGLPEETWDKVFALLEKHRAASDRPRPRRRKRIVKRPKKIEDITEDDEFWKF